MKDKLKTLYSHDQIQQIVQKLARQVEADYQPLCDEKNPLLVVVTLKGAMLFASDLIRHISVPLELDFVRLSSYGKETETSGQVLMTKDLETSVHDRHILLLDEIVDSGLTIQFLKRKISRESPRSVKIATLLDKPSRRQVEVDLDFVGTQVEDKFLIGYGLDFEEQYRNLKDICYVESSMS